MPLNDAQLDDVRRDVLEAARDGRDEGDLMAAQVAALIYVGDCIRQAADTISTGRS